MRNGGVMWSQVCVLLAVGGGGAHHNIQLPRDATRVSSGRVENHTQTQLSHSHKHFTHKGGSRTGAV